MVLDSVLRIATSFWSSSVIDSLAFYVADARLVHRSLNSIRPIETSIWKSIHYRHGIHRSDVGGFRSPGCRIGCCSHDPRVAKP